MMTLFALIAAYPFYAWFVAGFVGFVVGHFVSWYSGEQETLGDFLGSLFICLLCGGLTFICVGAHLISICFNSKIMIYRGRKN